MLTVTAAAGDHLAQLLTDVPDGMAVRFVPEGRVLMPRIDQPRPEDETYDYRGRTVLVLDEEVAALLNKRTLDVRETRVGTHLALV